MKLSADRIRKALSFTGKNDIRFYLNGVYVERHPVKGAYIVATDGHRMLVQHDESAILTQDGGNQAPPLVLNTTDKAFHAAVKKAAKDETGTVQLDAEWKLEVWTGQRQIYQGLEAGTHDAKYPDWRRVVPDLCSAVTLTPGLKGAVNVSYIGDLNITAGHYGSAYFYQADPDSAILALFPTDPQAFGVIMPIRSEKTGLGLTGLYMAMLETAKGTRQAINDATKAEAA